MIQTLLMMIYNGFRFLFMKALYGKRFNSYLFQRISPYCSIQLFGKGKIHIGKNIACSADCDFKVLSTGELSIGEGCYFNRFCMISAHEKVTIGSGCMFGPGVKIFDNNHKHTPENGVSYQLTTKPIEIGNNCWIASDVIILKGAKIGDNCVIGAQCIVHGEIPAGSVIRKKSEYEYL